MHFHVLMHACEPRRMLSMNVTPAEVLVIRAPADQPNAISIVLSEDKQQLLVSENDQQQQYPLADVRQIRVRGGNGADMITLGEGVAVDADLFGRDGNDQITVRDAPSRIRGDRGDDLITGGSADDTIAGGKGADSVDGGDGADQVDGGPGADRLRGQKGDDLIYGNGGRDRLNGGDGGDTLQGNVGPDSLLGGAGHDNLLGGEGVDTASGNLGRDRIVGGSDLDILWDDAGRNEITQDGPDGERSPSVF